MQLSVIPGQRFLIKDAVVLRVSHYQCELPHGHGEGTAWRYLFKTPQGHVVYTGKWLDLKPGDKRDMRATCKRFETFAGLEMCRIKRPVFIVEKPLD